MLNLSIKWDATDYSYPGRKGFIQDSVLGRVCRIETWAFRSCACFLLQEFDPDIQTWTKEQCDYFWNWISQHDKDLSYYPDEIYFLLSDTQLKRFPRFYKRKEIRLRDRFTNKSHGPNDVYLFRYSKAGDWQRRVINA